MPRLFRTGTTIEMLEARMLLSGTYDVSGVDDVALSQPLIHYFLRRAASGPPLQTSDGIGGTTFDNQAYLDTGTSGVVLSQETSQAFNINSDSFNNQPVTFTDIGIGGGQNFGVSEMLYTALASNNPNTDLDNLSDYQTVYNQPFGPVRFEVTQQPSPDPFDPQDIMGMPVMQGKVVVMDPTPIFDPSLPQDMNTYIYNPGAPYRPSQATTDPGIPSTSLHVRLGYGDFSPYTGLSPAGAPGPALSANPFVGPDPLIALNPNLPPDSTPPLSFARGAYSATGSFLFDTGAQSSFMSQAEAAKLHVHYQSGTYNSANPVLVDDNGNKVPNQYVVPLQGVGGTVNVAGFQIDSLTLQTTEGTPIVFHNVPITVLDVSVQDPKTGKTLTLDGDFGANFLVASMNNGNAAAFNWVTFDQPDGLLGFAPAGAITPPKVPSVVGRFVFYNNSAFDGRDPTANAADDNAIATDKQALVAGATGPASFANYTSYSKGINGIMVDIANLPSGATPTLSDFVFTAGGTIQPSTWSAAPAPSSFLVRAGAGANGSTRLEFTWADHAVQNEWLQVTVKADADTGLSGPDVFYFGNLVGETGKPAVNGQFVVTAADATAARADAHGFINPAPVTNTHDFNRDGRVDAADQLIARFDVNHTLAVISAPPAATAAAALQPALTPPDPPTRSRRHRPKLLHHPASPRLPARHVTHPRHHSVFSLGPAL